MKELIDEKAEWENIIGIALASIIAAIGIGSIYTVILTLVIAF